MLTDQEIDGLRESPVFEKMTREEKQALVEEIQARYGGPSSDSETGPKPGIEEDAP
mgnify:CR=1